MNDCSGYFLRGQERVEFHCKGVTYPDRGILTEYPKSSFALQERILDKMWGNGRFFVFYGSREIPSEEGECLLTAGGQTYRRLTSRVIRLGKDKIAVRSILERCSNAV